MRNANNYFLLLTLIISTTSSLAFEKGDNLADYTEIESVYRSKLVLGEKVGVPLLKECMGFQSETVAKRGYRAIFNEGFYVTDPNTDRVNMIVPGEVQKGSMKPMPFIYFCNLDAEGKFDRKKSYFGWRYNDIIERRGGPSILGNPRLKVMK